MNFTSPQHKLKNPAYGMLFIIVGSLLLRLIAMPKTNLLVEEAYYWNYAQHLDFGYLDHPPMVALLIKLSTLLFGTHEFGVRASSLFCWFIASYFSFKWTNLLKPRAGIFAIALLAILPFFFLHALIITPDQPLIACWSAGLYCLYRCLVRKEARYWYGAGVCFGLGLLSKYTMVLLGVSGLIYMAANVDAWHWFRRKEPYLCALIALILFSPVIYWNMQHDWASFAFQSTRRIHAQDDFSLHYLLGLVVLFLLPPGLWGLWRLFSSQATRNIAANTRRFFQIFSLVPVLIFACFSLSHSIKFNWIGPSFLALIPWLALMMDEAPLRPRFHAYRLWLHTGIFLLLTYTASLFIITYSKPMLVYQSFFQKFIAWDDLTQQVHQIAQTIERETKEKPIIIPLETYNLGSEFNFYQAKFLAEKKINAVYPIVGRHVFGLNSLMYRYWAPKPDLHNKVVIIIAKDRRDLSQERFKDKFIARSPIQIIWSHSQSSGMNVHPHYYQILEMKA
jgi:4-amino-4-deoxy-L-arabinose transferase-like glycosyltransferase